MVASCWLLVGSPCFVSSLPLVVCVQSIQSILFRTGLGPGRVDKVLILL